MRWYCWYRISYRDLGQMMGERGVHVDHSHYLPLGSEVRTGDRKAAALAVASPAIRRSWRLDETYVKVETTDPARVGFQNTKTAYAATMGFEAIRALRKGQAAIFNLTRDIRGETRIVERAFSIGASALAEAVAVISEQLDLQLQPA